MQYKIVGEPLSVVICDVQPDETLITENGSMSWMSPNMKMETTTNGGIGKAFGRMFSGESMFQNRYTAQGGPGQIAFASSFPGSIRAIEVTPDKPIIVQKSGFLAATEGVDISIFFQKKFASGLFGGEGFIMQKISGSGTVFVEIDGYACEYQLAPGQQILVDTGYLALMDSTCSMDVQTVAGLKNKLFGGEGFFNTVITGPGKVILQTMPICAVANSLKPYFPTSGGNK